MSRRSNGEGTAYKVAPGRWEGQVWVENSGRRRRVKRSGKTKAEVLAKLREVREEDERGIDVSDRGATVAQLLEDWLTNVAPAKVEPETVKAYRWAAEDHIVPRIGNRKVKSLSVGDVEHLLRRMAADGMSRWSCVRVRAVLGAALKWAQRRDLVGRNVATLAELPADATPAREGRALTPEEAQRLLTAAETVTVKIPRTDRTETRPRRTAALWVLQLVLGLRPGEVNGLTWEAVDLDEGLVHVRSAMRYDDDRPVGLAEVKTGNMGRGRRTLNLPPMAVDALRRHRKAQNEERMALGKYWPQEWSGLVFHTEAGTPYRPSNLRRELRKIQTAAKIEGRLTRYDLRHSAATIMVAAGMRLEDVADILGHEDTTMTRGVYAHATGRPLAGAADVMQKVLGA